MKRLLSLLLAGLLPLLALAGCGNVFEAEYTFAVPYSGGVTRGGGDATEIGNYNMLKSALIDLVNNHGEHATFRFSRYNGSVADDLAAACLEIRTTNPLGAYAVEALTCDTSRIVSYYTADVNVAYKKTAEEIRSIVGVSSLTDLEARLREAVTDAAAEIVLRVYSSQVDEDYLRALTERLYFSDPVTVATEPEAEIASYPGEGINRIYDIRLQYGADPARLRYMSRQLSDRVGELAEMLVSESAPQRALECADSLDTLLEKDAAGSYGSTAYGAIVERSADSKGVALAYKALCDAAGLDCMVVKGNLGDMGAEEHYWNILALEGAYYHVDVSAFPQGRSGAFLADDAGFWGAYLWDAEDYPACTGSLRYTDVVPEAAEAFAEDNSEAQPQEETPAESPAPAETDAPTEEAKVPAGEKPQNFS